MRRLFSLAVIILVLSFHLQGCAEKKEFIQLFFPSGNQVTAELAITEQEKLLGLMFRDEILSDQGMLFVYEEKGYHSFWMKNVSFPIDIIWLDEEKRIIHIIQSVPPCLAEDCPSYRPEKPAQYVLELKAGKVTEEGLELYDRLDFILESN
jgi:uncharacterized membrane protein (UPF0127 family)